MPVRSTGKTVQNSVIIVTDDCIVTFIPRAFCQPLGLGLGRVKVRVKNDPRSDHVLVCGETRLSKRVQE